MNVWGFRPFRCALTADRSGAMIPTNSLCWQRLENLKFSMTVLLRILRLAIGLSIMTAVKTVLRSLRNGRRPMRERMKRMMRRFLRKSRRSAKEKAVVLKSDRSFTLAPNIQMQWARRLLRKAGSASQCTWEAMALGSPVSLGPS